MFLDWVFHETSTLRNDYRPFISLSEVSDLLGNFFFERLNRQVDETRRKAVNKEIPEYL